MESFIIDTSTWNPGWYDARVVARGDASVYADSVASDPVSFYVEGDEPNHDPDPPQEETLAPTGLAWNPTTRVLSWNATNGNGYTLAIVKGDDEIRTFIEYVPTNSVVLYALKPGEYRFVVKTLGANGANDSIYSEPLGVSVAPCCGAPPFWGPRPHEPCERPRLTEISDAFSIGHIKSQPVTVGWL